MALYIPEEEVSYVYLMRDANGVYKVGKSDNPLNRRTQVEATRGVSVELISTVLVKNPLGIEAQLRDQFRAKKEHKKNDWFNLSVEDVGYILSVFGDLAHEPRPQVIARNLSGTLTALEIAAALSSIANADEHISHIEKAAVYNALEAVRHAVRMVSALVPTAPDDD